MTTLFNKHEIFMTKSKRNKKKETEDKEHDVEKKKQNERKSKINLPLITNIIITNTVLQ